MLNLNDPPPTPPAKWPPPPFIPKAYFREHSGGGKSSIMAGTWRSKANKSVRIAAETALSSDVAKRSASDSRLQTGRSERGSTSTSRSRPSTSGRTAIMWETLAPLARRDHVSNLLCQPLPVRGEDHLKDYQRHSSVGALPRAPTHIAAVQSSGHATHSCDDDFRKGVRAQKASEQWCGFPRNFFSDFNEQVVKQGHIMRD